ncbi:hypothetical protein [Burkholderia sp. ABCPW 14]|uniref:hypothetical protein n=1 Tax=Burkholderia sp. ABCPW 14 TaxID=1637860 RepID=UPI000AF6C2B7|nr:hypothetical protein [Burkholderia sp. ABCPW 14]
MNVLIVTYDLIKQTNSEAYTSILNIIKSEKNWAKLSESSYAMHTNMTPKAVYERARPYLDEKDNFMVFTLTSPYFGRHSKEVIDWLQAKINQ